MSRRQGYTKRVLEEKILIYESVLLMRDLDIKNWIELKHASTNNCPVCSYREKYLKSSSGYACWLDNFEPCLEIVNDVVCWNQDWFKTLSRAVYGKGFVDYNKLRQILKTRLKYWQKIYAEKYPEVVK